MIRRTAICTIAAKNYLPFVRVLMESVRQHHPEAQRFLILSDRIDGYFDPQAEDFEIIESADLPIPDGKWFHFKYSLLELSTAVKPYALSYLFLRNDLDQLIYLDPDIKLYRPLDGVMQALESHQAVLTPHITTPLPDQHLPGDFEILRTGAYNLGFLGLAASREVTDFLNWWQAKLYDHCVADFSRGLFVDQRWMDLAPSLLDRVTILRDPGYNVAYWNLANREIQVDQGQVRVNEMPLSFFHFSGVNPDAPEELSRHQDSVRLLDTGAVRGLVLSYLDEVRARGHAICKGWPYAYGSTTDGARIAEASRAAVREQPELRTNLDPFSVEGARGPRETASAADRGLSFLARRIYDGRPDLQMRFPDVEGRDRLAFLTWLFTYGRHEHGLDEPYLAPIREQWSQHVASLPGLVPRTAARAALWKASAVRKAGMALQAASGGSKTSLRKQRDATLPDGLNLIGYLNAKTGVGQAGRSMLEAARSAGLNVHLIDADATSPAADLKYAFSLFHVNADQTARVMGQLGSALKNRSYRIGYWFWELDTFPDKWLGSFDYCDEIWVATSFCQAAIARVSPRPVVRIPPPIPRVAVQPVNRAVFEIPEDSFVFVSVFDLKSGFERKNPLAAVEAFRKAFGDSSRAFLLLKMTGVIDVPARLEALHQAVEGNPRIRIIHRELDAAEMTSLMQSADCLVSLHRSEGFGLPMAEAMLLGKPVICTAYSGNLDFTQPSTAFLVDYRMKAVGEGSPPYDSHCLWADASVEHAASLMRTVFENPDLREKIARAGQRYIETHYSPSAIGRMIRDRIDRIKTFRS